MVRFKTYKDLQEAIPVIELLQENNIEFEINNMAPSMDIKFIGGSGLDDTIELKVQLRDLYKAHELLQNINPQILENLHAESPLSAFSDKDLMNVLKQFDAWNPTDFLLARELLQQRGIEFSDHDIETFKQQRILHLSKPEKGSKTFMVIGYTFSLLALGVIIGAFIGYSYFASKKPLPNGEKVHVYDTYTRNHGQKIFLVNLIALFLWVIVYFLIANS